MIEWFFFLFGYGFGFFTMFLIWRFINARIKIRFFK